MTNFKHAAMFGLDARIALAIFASLSIISGAAMFGYLNSLQMTQYSNLIKTLEDSMADYLIKNGEDLNGFWDMRGTHFPFYNPHVSQPWTEGKSDSTIGVNSYSTGVIYDEKGFITNASLRKREPVEDGYQVGDWAGTRPCDKNTPGRSCHYWLRDGISDNGAIANTTQFLAEIDELYDNSDGKDAGRVRWGGSELNFMLMPTLKQGY